MALSAQKKGILVVTCFLTLLLVSNPLLGESERSIRASIEDVGLDMQDALREGDAKRMATFYTEDAKMYAMGQPTIRGREEIERHMQYFIDLGLRSFKVQIDDLFGAGNMAVEIGTCTFWNKQGHELSRVRFLTIWKKENGDWKIHRDMATI